MGCFPLVWRDQASERLCCLKNGLNNGHRHHEYAEPVPIILSVPRNQRLAFKYIVRHGVMRFLGEYEAGEGQAFPRSSLVIVRSERGQEVGEILCEANPLAVQLISEPTHGQV